MDKVVRKKTCCRKKSVRSPTIANRANSYKKVMIQLYLNVMQTVNLYPTPVYIYGHYKSVIENDFHVLSKKIIQR